MTAGMNYLAVWQPGNGAQWWVSQVERDIKHDRKAASRFLRKAIDQCGDPQKITIDKSGANTAAIAEYDIGNKASSCR